MSTAANSLRLNQRYRGMCQCGSNVSTAAYSLRLNQRYRGMYVHVEEMCLLWQTVLG